MNRPSISSQSRSKPLRAGSPTGPTVPGDKTVTFSTTDGSDIRECMEEALRTPFGPVADTIGRPYIRPHRLAQTMGDPNAVYRRRPPLQQHSFEWLWILPTLIVFGYFVAQFLR